MTLSELLRHVAQLDRGATIFVRRPWTPEAECAVVVLDETFATPEDVKAAGLVYFLEVDVALEVLEVFGDRQPPADETVRLLLYYAENDAFPEWVYL